MSFDIFGACPDENEIEAAKSTTVLTDEDLSQFSVKELESWCDAFMGWYDGNSFQPELRTWLKKIRPIYMKRLPPVKRDVYRVTGVDGILTLNKKSLVWKKRRKPLASFTTRDKPSEWHGMAQDLEINGAVIKSEAVLSSIAFTSRIVWDFNVALSVYPQFQSERSMQQNLEETLKVYWKENEVTLFYPIKGSVVAIVMGDS